VPSAGRSSDAMTPKCGPDFVTSAHVLRCDSSKRVGRALQRWSMHVRRKGPRDRSSNDRVIEQGSFERHRKSADRRVEVQELTSPPCRDVRRLGLVDRATASLAHTDRSSDGAVEMLGAKREDQEEEDQEEEDQGGARRIREPRRPRSFRYLVLSGRLVAPRRRKKASPLPRQRAIRDVGKRPPWRRG
jgi:hypothetical protein